MDFWDDAVFVGYFWGEFKIIPLPPFKGGSIMQTLLLVTYHIN